MRQLLVLLTILCISGCKDGVSPSGNGHGKPCGIGTQYPDQIPYCDPDVGEPGESDGIVITASTVGVRVCPENLQRNASASEEIIQTECWCECIYS